LLKAARVAGTRRFVAQSFAGWPFAREGGPIKAEEDPLDPNPPMSARQTIAAIREAEALVTGANDLEGIVLRYGFFCGPGTSLGAGGKQLDPIRRRLLPVFGSGAGLWSFVHICDAAEATRLAVDHGKPGIYNIVDDDPAPVSEWLPALAGAIGAKPPSIFRLGSAGWQSASWAGARNLPVGATGSVSVSMATVVSGKPGSFRQGKRALTGNGGVSTQPPDRCPTAWSCRNQPLSQNRCEVY
jgi:nucleoside-diphosphate-sugar epimerase